MNLLRSRNLKIATKVLQTCFRNQDDQNEGTKQCVSAYTCNQINMMKFNMCIQGKSEDSQVLAPEYCLMVVRELVPFWKCHLFTVPTVSFRKGIYYVYVYIYNKK